MTRSLPYLKCVTKVFPDAAIGSATHLTEIQADLRHEYEKLTEEEKKATVDEFVAHRDTNPAVVRVSGRSCLLDVMNVTRNIQELVSGIRDHICLCLPTD